MKVFAYNQQVVDSLTESIRSDAQKAGVPVVGVYETMPTPGYDYQSWMLAETNAIEAAVATAPPPSTCDASRRWRRPVSGRRAGARRSRTSSVVLGGPADPRRTSPSPSAPASSPA